MDYDMLLTDSYITVRQSGISQVESRGDFIASFVIDLATCDGDLGDQFGKTAATIAEAISSGTTFELIKDPAAYRNYALYCNLPFFAERIEWGGSIRGAWWKSKQPPLDSTGLFYCDIESTGRFIGTKQVTKLDFVGDQWNQFVAAMVRFVRV